MNDDQIKQLQDKLKASEASADRLCFERDSFYKQVQLLERELDVARSANPSDRHHKEHIKQLLESARIDKLKMQVMRIEIGVLKDTVRLLKQKKAIREQ